MPAWGISAAIHCSSPAASITGRDVRLMRAAHPGVPVVTYVNSSADVKAESDVCCTSSNAVQVAEWAAAEWGTDRVIVIPDEYPARNVAGQTSLRVITWAGRCEVHERFSADDIAGLYRAAALQRRGTDDIIFLDRHPLAEQDS